MAAGGKIRYHDVDLSDDSGGKWVMRKRDVLTMKQKSAMYGPKELGSIGRTTADVNASAHALYG